MVPQFILDAMDHCIDLAMQAAQGGNYPLGAAIVSESGIVASSKSELIVSSDPSAHPEMVAIRLAASKLASRYLPGLFLVSTLEPCPMCTSAAIWGKMAGIAFGTSQATAKNWGKKLNNPVYTFRQIDIECSFVVSRGVPELLVFPGVHSAKCDKLLELVG